MEGGSSGRKPSTAIEMTPAMDELVKRITVTVSHGFAADVVVVGDGGVFLSLMLILLLLLLLVMLLVDLLCSDKSNGLWGDADKRRRNPDQNHLGQHQHGAG